MDLELLGKTAIVTGGSRGIGKAIARALALEGVDVAIVARNSQALGAAAQELTGETDRRVIPISADTGDDESVRLMVRQAAEAFGRLDILVNCAAQAGGQGPAPRFGEFTSDHLWPEMNVKVMGYLRTAQEVAPYMRQQGWGRIINISGLAARRTGAVMTGIRNVALVALTKNLADELGPHGINVTVVHPGLTRTEASPNVFARQAQLLGISVEEVELRMAQGNTVRRIIDARDIANVVTFLASPKAVAINGDVIAAGGGQPGGIYY